PLSGVKRTCRFALHMSASDPKRTSLRSKTDPLASACASCYHYVSSLGATMRRREFITLLGATATWPIAVRAQTSKLRTIGFLGTDATNWAAWTAAFVARMRELGWIERSTIAIEYRWSEGRTERVVEVAAEFVRLKVDVIVSYGTAIPALMQAT